MAEPFDHRSANVVLSETAMVRQGQAERLSTEAHQNPLLCPLPRNWVNQTAVTERLVGRWKRLWFLGWRDITAATNERTVITSLIPIAGVSDKFLLILADAEPVTVLALYANLAAFCFDFVARQKLGGVSLKYFVMKQLPVLPPATYAEPCAWAGQPAVTHRDWLLPRVLELTYTAWDLEAFAQDCGWSGPPFRWDEDRRFLLRCEQDAAFFHLYLGTEAEWSKQPEALTKAFPTPRHAVDYILDTFPIVKRKDVARTAVKNAAGEVVKPGRYLTKDTILEIYDALAASMQTGKPYQTKLDPPPADPRCCHPPKKTPVPT